MNPTNRITAAATPKRCLDSHEPLGPPVLWHESQTKKGKREKKVRNRKREEKTTRPQGS
jgi:hypothetical protein